jgi:hypothetical protein
MYTKECKWCKEIVIVEKQPNYASHVATCKKNPNIEKNKLKLSELYKGKYKVERIVLDKVCPKCDTKFQVQARKSEILRNKVKNYCSRKCSNSRSQSISTRNKISQSIKEGGNLYKPNSRPKNYPPFTCIKCGKEGVSKKYNKNQKYHYECWITSSGGIRKGSSRGKSGWYKGYWCDSSYELAYLIYSLEKSVKIERNKIGFPYVYNNKNHLFYPDFIADNEYVEIKNFKSEITDTKVKFFPYPIKVYYKNDMKPILEHVKDKYGKDFTSLYELKNIE